MTWNATTRTRKGETSPATLGVSAPLRVRGQPDANSKAAWSTTVDVPNASQSACCRNRDCQPRDHLNRQFSEIAVC
jgi:hypothetical protein